MKEGTLTKAEYKKGIFPIESEKNQFPNVITALLASRWMSMQANTQDQER